MFSVIRDHLAGQLSGQSLQDRLFDIRRRSRAHESPKPIKSARPDYLTVHALLIRWEYDDLGVKSEIEVLSAVFQELYGFQVESYSIPNEESDRNLHDFINDFVRRREDEKTLFLVYYGGHSFLNKGRMPVWSCTANEDSPVVQWYPHQALLENSTSDVLFLLDCCSAVGVTGNVRRDTKKEIISATGADEEAPGVGSHSFSRALIEVLFAMVSQPFSSRALHNELVNWTLMYVPSASASRKTPHWNFIPGGKTDPICITSYAVFPLHLIAIMGATGSGKSSLINRLCHRDAALVGRGLESTTQDLRVYVSVVDKQSVTFIDCPGFNDTYLSDSQLLVRISTYLKDRFTLGQKLTGLLFLRDITEVKMTAEGRKNLNMFLALVGKDSLRNVRLVTTKWDKLRASNELELGEEREADLRTKFWTYMMEQGCGEPKRDAHDTDASKELIAPLLTLSPLDILIQKELDRPDAKLSDTSAGRYLEGDLREHLKELDRPIDPDASIDPAIRQALEQSTEEAKDAVHEQMRNQTAILTQPFEEVVKQERKRRENVPLGEFFGNFVEYSESFQKDHPTSEVRMTALNVGAALVGMALQSWWKRRGVAEEDMPQYESLDDKILCDQCSQACGKVHYHCDICKARRGGPVGNFDLCMSCVNKGLTCGVKGHTLVKRTGF